MRHGIGCGLVSLVVLALVGTSSMAAQSRHTLTVSAGDAGRIACPVALELPGLSGHWRLRDAGGAVHPIDIGADGSAVFLIDLAAGEQRVLELEPAEAPASPAARVERAGGEMIATVGQRQVLRYRGADGRVPPGVEQVFRRDGYIHPVLTPSGRIVSDDYPPNHRHHHGIWSPWTSTSFQGRRPDFWNMAARTGTVEVSAFGGEQSGQVRGSFRAEHRMVDLSADPPVAALHETWEVTVYGGTGPGRGYFLFDLTIRQRCATDSPLVLERYLYGGLGFRGNRQWDGAGNARFLTSEGHGRADGNETRARWCWIGGTVDGQPTGVAILSHPDNFRHPEPLRIHPTEPFVCFAPPQLGSFRIEPGQTYVARYRFVAADGPADGALIERLWRDFADPPRVQVR